MQGFDCFTLIGFLLSGMHIWSVSVCHIALEKMWFRPQHVSELENSHCKMSYLRQNELYVYAPKQQVFVFFVFFTLHHNIIPLSNYSGEWDLINIEDIWLIKEGICAPVSNLCARTGWFSKVTSLPHTDIMDMSLLSVFVMAKTRIE